MRLVLLAVVLTGCGAFQKKEKEIQIEEGEGCTVTESEEGSVISCPDGTSTVLKNGKDGSPGAAGKAGSRGPAGSSGARGSSCTTAQTETGTRINCDDGTESLITHGSGCTISEAEYGYDLTCGDTTVPIRHGSNGAPGGPGEVGPPGEMGPPGSGVGNGHMRRCSSQYVENYWWWDLEFKITQYNDWAMYELFEVGHNSQTGSTQTRQGGFIGSELKQVTAQVFGATLKGDEVTFLRLGTNGITRCNLGNNQKAN